LCPTAADKRQERPKQRFKPENRIFCFVCYLVVSDAADGDDEESKLPKEGKPKVTGIVDLRYDAQIRTLQP
jgi:hypothetical protein